MNYGCRVHGQRSTNSGRCATEGMEEKTKYERPTNKDEYICTHYVTRPGSIPYERTDLADYNEASNQPQTRPRRTHALYSQQRLLTQVHVHRPANSHRSRRIRLRYVFARSVIVVLVNVEMISCSRFVQ